jgi:glycogen debranching enzyme
VAEDLILIDGTSFFYTEADGNVDGHHHEGFFFEDVRHLSRWRLTLDGQIPDLVSAKRVDYFSGRIVLTREDIGIAVRRDRFAADGIHEDIVLENRTDERKRVQLDIHFGSDFADVRAATEGETVRAGKRDVALGPRSVTLSSNRRGYTRGTRIGFSRRPGELSSERARFEVTLAPGATWQVCVEVEPITEGKRHPALLRCGSFGAPEPHMPVPIKQFLGEAPELETDDPDLAKAYGRGLHDVGGLRLRPTPDLEWMVPAGGIPWFMTLFGRDSLITSYALLPFAPELAAATLHALAERQATEWDDFADAEPGKILHELRRGTLANLGEIAPIYYGGHDSTMLFLIVLDEYERWTGDRALVRELEGAARAALAWIDGPADRDRDGYLEYETRAPDNPAHLDNQGWKDSSDAIVDSKGRQAPRPHATCELQGFAYSARLALARLARDVYRDADLAEHAERDAAQLRRRFNRDFWIPAKRQFALALDRDKKQVDAFASNAGHLLWSGIADAPKARATVQALMRDDMRSGWGLRSLSAREKAYDPLSYHRGSVWPHDSVLIAHGMRRAGYAEEAAQIVRDVLDAAAAFTSELPELYSGYPRDETGLVVEYPGAMRPQAWAGAAPLLGLRVLLGLEMEDGQLRVDPRLPAGMQPFVVRGLRVRGKRVDVASDAAVTPTRRRRPRR